MHKPPPRDRADDAHALDACAYQLARCSALLESARAAVPASERRALAEVRAGVEAERRSFQGVRRRSLATEKGILPWPSDAPSPNA